MTPEALCNLVIERSTNVSSEDPFHITWNPGMKFITDAEIELGAMFNPPYNSKLSKITGFGALELSQYL